MADTWLISQHTKTNLNRIKLQF